MEQERGAFKVNRETRSRMARKRSVLRLNRALSHVAMQKNRLIKSYAARHICSLCKQFAEQVYIFSVQILGRGAAFLRRGVEFFNEAIHLPRERTVAWFLRFR
jgi:hypothetical protein